MSNNVCSNEITSEDYVDVISRFRLDQSELSNMGIRCINAINGTWAVLSFPPEEPLAELYRDFGYFRIPKLFTITETTSMDVSGVTRVINHPVLNYTGENVIVGLIDTGIDYTHPVFRNRQGKTRIKAIWDQSIAGDNPPAEIGYGNVYGEDDINNALESENPFELVPGDIPDGHGTFMAGIAAGSETDSEFTGAAPQADIVMVKLKPAKQYLRDFYLIREDAAAYSETDIMFGIKFLNQIASRLSKPLVVFIGLGTSYGPHNSDTPLGDYISEVSGQAGTAVVTPSGNEGNERGHFLGQMSGAETQTVDINVGRGERGFMVELWGKSPDVYTVGLISPSGEQIPRIPVTLSGSSEIEFVFERTKVHIDYRFAEVLSGIYLVSMRFEAPAEGIWRINVYGNQIVHGVYNMWLPVRDFLSGSTYFLNSDPDITITSPGVVERSLTVSAYDHYTNSIYINSGRGFTAGGLIKPDIAAPGVNVYGPAPGGRYVRRSGTSVAAAHVAGCSALLFNWGANVNNLRYMNTASVKNILIKGADRDSTMVYPNRLWGDNAIIVSG